MARRCRERAPSTTSGATFCTAAKSMRFNCGALRNKDRAFAAAIGLHAVALIISAFAIGAGVLGAHGELP